MSDTYLLLLNFLSTGRDKDTLFAKHLAHCPDNADNPRESLYATAESGEHAGVSFQMSEEYSYVIPDVKRSLLISHDVMVVGKTVTSKPERNNMSCKTTNYKEKDSQCLPNGISTSTISDEQPPALPPLNDEYCCIPVSIMKPRPTFANKPTKLDNDPSLYTKRQTHDERVTADKRTAVQLGFASSGCQQATEDDYEIPTKLPVVDLEPVLQDKAKSNVLLISTIPQSVTVVDSEHALSQERKRDEYANVQQPQGSQTQEDDYEVPVIAQNRLQNFEKNYDNITQDAVDCVETSTTE